MRRTFSIIVLALGLAFAVVPAASAAYPPEAPPDACVPYITALNDQITAEGNEIYARDVKIFGLLDGADALRWRLATQTEAVHRLRHTVRHDRAVIRSLRRELAAAHAS